MVEDPEAAEVILINTCSVRQHAEQRVLGRVGELNKLKLKASGRIIGVLGCMAQRMGDKLFESARHVDMIVGPGSYRNLPATIALLTSGAEHLSVLDNGRIETYEGLGQAATGKVSALVPVMRGCSEFCTYCLVPSVRGEERNRTPRDVLSEVKKTLANGAVEITLLGQNITAYRHGDVGLDGLLDAVSKLDGLKRLRFVTSHPRHLSEAVIDVMASRPNICNSIHLPVQSGSNRILRLMGRRYSAEDYIQKAGLLRKKVDRVSITTDIIAGFPGETRDDFEQTLSLMNEVIFDNAFTFKYSPRPGTPALKLRSDEGSTESQDRLEELIDLQRRHTAMKNNSFVGKNVEVMVDRPSKKGDGEVFGKTTCARSVVFNGTGCKAGDLVKVNISGTTGPTLLGRTVE
jgi:tRNA-2-methylthio-N6-dimethylallyladenosine synthase